MYFFHFFIIKISLYLLCTRTAKQKGAGILMRHVSLLLMWGERERAQPTGVPALTNFFSTCFFLYIRGERARSHIYGV